MAVLGQAPAERMLGGKLLVSILEQSFTFLGKVALTEEATAAARRNRPGDSVPYLYRPSCVIKNWIARADCLDPAKCFVPQNGWCGSRAMSLIRVQIAPANGAAAHSDEGLSFTKLWEGKLLDRQGLAGPHK